MYGSEDSFGPTFTSAATTVLFGFAQGVWFKKKPGSAIPMVVDGVALVGGLGLRNKIHHPYGAAIAEGVGYGGGYGTGENIAANLKTFGAVAGPIPRNRSANAGSFGWVPGNPGAGAAVNPPVYNFGWTPVNEMGIAG